jgi:HK97 family phage major capsid protein
MEVNKMKYFDEEKFKALVQDTTFSAGGLLNPAQANRFIDLMTDNQIILKECDVKRMVTNSLELERLGMASRQLRKHSAGVAGTSADITADKRTLTLVESKIWFEIDLRTLRRLTIESDNRDIDGALMRHIMEMGAIAYGNDIEDLGVNGDSADTGASKDFIAITDGWLKYAKTEGHVYDITGKTGYIETIFPGMLALMPEAYRSRQSELRFFTTPAIRDAYIDEIVGTSTAGSLAYLTGGAQPTYKEIPVIGVPVFPENTILLTNPKNLAFGIDTNGIERDFDKKVVERVIQAVIIAAIGFQIANEDAIVVGYEVPEETTPPDGEETTPPDGEETTPPDGGE